jgi:N-sulfoglucosamine sulfohydrolase
MQKPNILFLHSHNTGRYVQPYGHAIPAPRLQGLAEDGVIFRNAFAAAPTCSPSRAAFMTGMTPHSCGMLGLAHRGFAMPDYRRHLANHLKSAGYQTVLSGVEHTAPDVRQVGYDRILAAHPIEGADLPRGDAAEAAAAFLRSGPRQPFFLSVGLSETHRPFPKAQPARFREEDPRFSLPPRPLPDTPETRADMADFAAAVRAMDGRIGTVLDALRHDNLAAGTWVFCFCDHGLQFPRNMCNLTDHGIGVYLVVRGPGAAGGRAVDAMVSLLDLFPTACELGAAAVDPAVQGRSLLPLLKGRTEQGHERVFAEVTYHAACEPMRCVRTLRHKYIRRYDHRGALVLPNADDTPSKQHLLSLGWEQQPRDQEELYDLAFDPDETHNLVGEARAEDVRGELSSRLDEWMKATDDPLLAGAVRAPAGSCFNDPDDRSPDDPTHSAT